MTLNSDVEKIVLTSKIIAIVGASRDSSKAANYVPEYLKEQGYTIIPVNPNADEILGEKAFPNLETIPINVDIVDIFRPSGETPSVVEQAVKIKPKLIWLQKGISNEQAKKIAKKHGIKFVMDHCLMMEHIRLTEK
ncbi:MAG: CoA-binding protein [Candidatus Heimdallarchaeota archaeon]|nr:CoA-binding protein [Candidatus Heimdallarchaeota archaeon]